MKITRIDGKVDTENAISELQDILKKSFPELNLLSVASLKCSVFGVDPDYHHAFNLPKARHYLIRIVAYDRMKAFQITLKDTGIRDCTFKETWPMDEIKQTLIRRLQWFKRCCTEMLVSMRKDKEIGDFSTEFKLEDVIK